MEIKHRMGLPRMTFHVFDRGARKVSIFAGDEDRGLFVHLFGKFALKHEVRITSWCLMPNHYHFEPDSEGTPLCRMMHDLNGTYSRIYNERHGMSGCLFQGPFRTTSIGDEAGLAYVSRYIHTNPVPLQVAPEEYRWSSCRAYLGLDPCPEWLDPSPVLSLMGEDKASQQRAYAAYLKAAPPRRRKAGEAYDQIDDFYREYIRHLEEKCTEAMTRVGEALGRVTLRTLVCWLAHHARGIPAAAIAQFFGYQGEESVRSLVARFQSRLEDDPALMRAIQTVNEIAARFR